MSEARDLQILTDPIGVCPCSACGVKLDLTGRPAFSTVRCPSCRAEMQVPARIGVFVLVELLGSGGMGSAYRARDESLNRDVAIKVMRKSFGDDPKFVETFRREAQTAARLNHPNVVQIFSFGEFKGQPYIVMELVTGGSLDRLINTGEPLDQTMVMRIGMEITSALQSGYQMQLVHGDIKPENILLDEKGAGKLVDFGIAQLAGGGSDSKEVWGTPYYVAPEKVRRQRTDCRADIYSLGGTLFHALAGKPPFDGPDATAVVKARFLKPAPPLRDVRADIDPEIESIVARMLQVEPSMRYPTYESLLGDMRRFLDRAGPSSGLTKKVMILKKKGASPTGPVPSTVKTAPVTSAAVPSAPPVSGPRPSGKLVIKARSAGPSLTTSAAAQPAGAVPVTVPQAVVTAPAKRGVPAGLIVALVVMGILLLGGLVFGLVALSKRNKGGDDHKGTAPNAAQAAHDAALRRVQDSLAQMNVVGSNLLVCSTTAERYCGIANKTVADVLGADQHDIMIPLRPPPPVKPVPAVPATPVAPAGTNAAGTNAASAAIPAPVAPPPPPPPPAVDPVREEALKEPVLVTVRNMYRAWYRIDEIVGEAATLSDEITSAIAVAPTTPPETLNLYADTYTDRITAFGSGSKGDEARRKLANIRNDINTVSNMVQVIRKRLDREAAAAKLAAEQAAATAAAAKREEERQAKIKTEIAGITAKEDEIRELLHKHAYNDARRQLRTVMASLTEEESLRAYGVATQRVARLEELRDFLIVHLPGYQSPQGWKIESADKNGLVVKSRNADANVSWADLGDQRMVLFMRVYLMDEEQSRSLKLREHVRLLIGASMYCRKFIPDSKAVQELADKMLERAAGMLPDAKAEIELFLPGAGLKAETDKPADAKPAEGAPVAAK
jgi:serine/threonine protein kinase